MGRHTAPQQQQPTTGPAVDPAPGWQWPDRAPQRQADPVAWWRQASPRRRSFAAVALAAPVLALVIAGNADGTSHTTGSTSPAESARMQGVHYAEQLRDRGQSTLSIDVNCMANTGGYSGTNFEDYQQGCVSVSMDMTASGRP